MDIGEDFEIFRRRRFRCEECNYYWEEDLYLTDIDTQQEGNLPLPEESLPLYCPNCGSCYISEAI